MPPRFQYPATLEQKVWRGPVRKPVDERSAIACVNRAILEGEVLVRVERHIGIVVRPMDRNPEAATMRHRH